MANKPTKTFPNAGRGSPKDANAGLNNNAGGMKVPVQRKPAKGGKQK